MRWFVRTAVVATAAVTAIDCAGDDDVSGARTAADASGGGAGAAGSGGGGSSGSGTDGGDGSAGASGAAGSSGKTGGGGTGGSSGSGGSGSGGGPGCPAASACAEGVCDASGQCVSFGGAFVLSDPSAIPCANANLLTGACSCPAGFTAHTLRAINDVGGSPHGALVHYCAPPTRSDTSEFGGMYQTDDAASGGQGCRAPNPFTGGCSCPTATSAIALRSLADVAGGSLIGSSLTVCAIPSAAPRSFGGAYQKDDAVPAGLGCRAANPATGDCSCPSGTVAQALRVLADDAAGKPVGSHAFLCVLGSSILPPIGSVPLCAGVSADASGATGASAALQACIDATAAGGTLELPAGTYRMDAQLVITKAITLRTQGTAGSGETCVASPALRCARLQAAPELHATGGFVHVPSATGVAFDHIVFDGNRDARIGSQSHIDCASVNRWGFNASAGNCTTCSFTYSASINALCGTGFEWRGNGATITNSVFRDNGTREAGPGDSIVRWADGLTLLESDGALVAGNQFIDNTDINFICGGARNATFRDNLAESALRFLYAGIMLDNFNGATHGDFTGTTVTNNTVECENGNCYFGFQLGPHPWYPSANIVGGSVTGNRIYGARLAINADGAGTVPSPIVVAANDIQGSPAQAEFGGCGLRPSGALNVAPGSYVHRNGETFAVTSQTFAGCVP